MTRMQKIVALVDGSLYSASVCDHAAWIAARTGAPVELIHVLGRREASDGQDRSGTIALGARTALLEQLADLDARRTKLIAARGRAILEDARALLDKAGIADVTTRLRQGDLVETVADIEADVRLIVIGKRGEGADFARGHLGSNLERIVRGSQVPVFVAARAFRPIARVLVGIDGGGSSMKAVELIARSPLFRGLAVQLVTVGTATAEARAALERARSLLSAAGIVAETAILPGQPETVLGHLVEEAPFDLLVMGAYGHSRIRSLIIGSTTAAMLRSCKVPVVLVR
ncbi:universal stress protein [Sinirhodobacter huangdaonensis]|uniref:Universal stress protein n=1 Tax=Paenirhodobacter huangdaonensis TaxID=2501515 RepID=A0A443LXX1_9RHOB|nr:universal stress protein [Sinirhodobacter huangdaonensis]RWR54073.1 universal stress protein [Sinirhodobacter huangdaonensis]